MFKFNMNLEKAGLVKDKASNDDDFIVVGAISSTSMDLQGETIALSALKEAAKAMRGVPIIKDHNPSTDNTVGIIEDAWTDGNKLMAQYRISKTEPTLRTKIEEGIIKSVSIGGDVLDYELVDGHKQLKALSIYEVSFTPIPANPDADIYQIIRKAMDILPQPVKEKEGVNMEKSEELKEKPTEPVKEEVEKTKSEKLSEKPVEKLDEVKEEESPKKEKSEKMKADPKPEEISEQEKVDKSSEISDLKKEILELKEEFSKMHNAMKEEAEMRKSVMSGRISVVKSHKEEPFYVSFIKGFKIK